MKALVVIYFLSSVVVVSCLVVMLIALFTGNDGAFRGATPILVVSGFVSFALRLALGRPGEEDGRE